MAPEFCSGSDVDHDEDKSHDKHCNKAYDTFSLSMILWQMLNGYESKPFNQCIQKDQIYKLIVSKNYSSFW